MEERFKKAEVGAWVGILGNLGLALIKLIAGYYGNSKALIADALHSASDVVGSFAVLIGLKVAKTPPDKEHPYGHGKAENIAAIIVAVILAVVGFELVSSTIKDLFIPKKEPPNWIALTIVIISILIKEGMFQYKYRLGKKLNSQALIANAWEHRSDVYSSIAALFGIAIAMLGKVLNLTILYYFDPIAGMVVALFVWKMAYDIGKEAVDYTLDRVVEEEELPKLVECIKQEKEVLRIDNLLVRQSGYYLIVDLKISVDPDITVVKGHEIGKRVKQNLLNNFSNIITVLVHINPFDDNN